MLALYHKYTEPCRRVKIFKQKLVGNLLVSSCLTHAGNTMDSRLMLVVNIVAVLGDSASTQERDAIKKVLAAIIY